MFRNGLLRHLMCFYASSFWQCCDKLTHSQNVAFLRVCQYQFPMQEPAHHRACGGRAFCFVWVSWQGFTLHVRSSQRPLLQSLPGTNN